jgi:hypothetical protein
LCISEHQRVGGAGADQTPFLIAFLLFELPLSLVTKHETPKPKDVGKKIRAKQPRGRGGGGRRRGGKPTFFAISRDGFFFYFVVFLNSPCYETPKTTPIKNEVSSYFFCGAAANVCRFYHFFYGAPCVGRWYFRGNRTYRDHQGKTQVQGPPVGFRSLQVTCGRMNRLQAATSDACLPWMHT